MMILIRIYLFLQSIYFGDDGWAVYGTRNARTAEGGFLQGSIWRRRQAPGSWGAMWV